MAEMLLEGYFDSLFTKAKRAGGPFVEYARNPRENDDAVDCIAALIEELGFRVPILARSDGRLWDAGIGGTAADPAKGRARPPGAQTISDDNLSAGIV
jgi:hypothetical protein